MYDAKSFKAKFSAQFKDKITKQNIVFPYHYSMLCISLSTNFFTIIATEIPTVLVIDIEVGIEARDVAQLKVSAKKETNFNSIEDYFNSAFKNRAQKTLNVILQQSFLV